LNQYFLLIFPAFAMVLSCLILFAVLQ
jgi:hypothetical protein